MNDDIDEFLESTEKYIDKPNGISLAYPSGEQATKPDSPGKQSEVVNPGEVCQYSMYGNSYVPTTNTVHSLPTGCYNIKVSSDVGVYASPAPPPSGLLLELPEMRSEEVIKMAELFWDSEKDYKEGNEFVNGGATFKAGCMLFGPAGSGKSCTLKLVSRKVVERGGTVFFADIHPYNVQEFLVKFSTVEKNRKCVVILEDLDSLISNHGESGYLNMLDSAQSIDNVLFIATTNYPDRLDPRIYNRPGRFSHVIKIGLPGPKARDAFLKAILKNHRDVPYIVEHSEGFSIDHISALINAVYREKKDLKSEIERLRKLFKIPKADEVKTIGF